MGDANLQYKNVSIEAVENDGTWTLITPGAGPTDIRASGGFRLASSESPGSDYMIVPSGTGYRYDSGAPIYVSMPVAGVVQTVKQY